MDIAQGNTTVMRPSRRRRLGVDRSGIKGAITGALSGTLTAAITGVITGAVTCGVAVLLTAATAGPAQAQGSGTTRLVVAFPPGGPVDLVARAIAEEMGKELGTRVIVENKAGANGAIGAEAVARAEPDGQTLWLTSVGAAAINPSLYPKLPYDMKRDFAPVSLVVNNVEVMVVSPQNPASNAAEFIAAARKDERLATLASSGTGSIPHFVIEQLADVSKTKLLHIPYKGAAPAITDVMGGQVGAFFGDVPGLLGHIKGGRLKPIGLAAEKRHPALPDVPTLAELGMPGVDSNNWYALFAPARTPPALIDKLNAAVRKTLAVPAVSQKLSSTGAEPAASSPQELATLLERDTVKWSDLIRAKKIVVE
jgi:tripartite-type tricarboxylate transporter receptor subunit TctC